MKTKTTAADPPRPEEPTTPASEPQFAFVSLDKVHASETNPRKTFGEDSLQELAKSIAAKGVLEPVLLRPRGRYFAHKNELDNWYVAHPRGRSTTEFNTLDCYHERDEDCRKAVEEKNREAGYEIVAGERRCRAARMAGLKVIPAIVRWLDDKAAAEAAVIENDQREDVPPLEQAEGYALLVTMGDDAETIAAKIGRPPRYVVGRLQLTHLVDELKADLRAGKLPFGHAYVLSKLKPEDQRAFFEKHAYSPSTWLYDYQGDPVPLDHLKRRIRDGFLPCLSAAPWKKDDAELLPEAGACATCPRRSGHNPTLFDELLNGDAKRGRDFCTDRGCYQKKHDAFLQLQIKRATEEAGEAPLKVSAEWYSRDPSVLDRDQYEEVSAKEARKAKPGELKTAVVVAGKNGTSDGVGRIVQVRVKKQQARRETASDKKWKQEQAARQKRAEQSKVAGGKAAGLVAEKVIRECRGEKLPSPEMLRQLVYVLVDAVWADASRIVARRRQLGKGEPRELVATLAGELTTSSQLMALAAELLAAKRASFWGSDPDIDAAEKSLWVAFGVDPNSIIRETRKADKPKKKPDAKRAGKQKAGAS